MSPNASLPLQVQPVRLIIPSIFVLVGLYVAYAGTDRILTQRRAVRTYEPVDATVRSSSVGTRGKEGSSELFYPEIQYRYHYDGEEFASSTVYPGGNYDSQDRARIQQLVNGFEAGDSVTAYVDPADPESSYLVAGALTTAWVFVGGGLALVLLGVGLGSVVV